LEGGSAADKALGVGGKGRVEDLLPLVLDRLVVSIMDGGGGE
jgi:hypothetical protein